jgi:spore coat protein U-like protein
MSQSRETGAIICMFKQLHTHTQKNVRVIAQSRPYSTSSAYVYVCALNLINSSVVYTLNYNQVKIFTQVIHKAAGNNIISGCEFEIILLF